MPYLPADRYDYDIFISYHHSDNISLPGQPSEEGGWVEQFVHHLEQQLASRGLRGLIVWLDRGRLTGATNFDQRIPNDLGRTGLFLAMHSHNYRQSDYCRKELGWFVKAAQDQPEGLSVNGERRLLNVLLHNIQPAEWEGDHWTCPLKGMAGFSFHDAPPGDPKEFGDPLKPSAGAAYSNAMRKVVGTVHGVLQALANFTASSPATPSPKPHSTGPVVFLADCPDSRDFLRRKLELAITEPAPLGARLADKVPPPLEALAHEAAAREVLARADCSVHLLDRWPGRHIHDGDGSYVRLQAELARERGKRALFCLPHDFSLEEVEDTDHRDWLRDLEQSSQGRGRYELIRGSAEQLVKDVLERIGRLAGPPPETPGERLVVVDRHPVDECEALQLATLLSKRARAGSPRLRVEFPRDGTAPEGRWDDFEQLVLRAHDLVVPFGQVEPQWVAQRLQRATQVVFKHDEKCPPLDRLWVLLLPGSRGREAQLTLSRLIQVRYLNNQDSQEITADTLTELLAGDKP